MLGLPPSVQIYYAVEPVDMRNGIDGLRAKVEQTLRKDPADQFLLYMKAIRDCVSSACTPR